MNEMKAYIEREIKERETIYLTKYVIAQQDYARESEDWQSYHGRELLELLQNADDEITDDLPARVKISFHDDVLTVSNNGEPFSEAGIVSLMYSNVSPKRKRKKEVIGNKGTGFRSVLGWAKEISIHSGDLHIRFTREHSQTYVDRLFKDKPGVPRDITAAVLAFPEWISDYKKSEYTTEISLVIKDDETVSEDIVKQINNINSELLLFLNRIEELIIETDENTRRFVKYGDTAIDYYVDEELVDHREWFMNRLDDNEYEDKKYSVVVAYDKCGDLPQKQVLYTFFPTKISFPYPVLVHANFDVDANRNHLVENEANRAILLTVADMLIDTAMKVNNKGVSYATLDFLMPNGEIPIDLRDYDFENGITEKIKNAPIFPTVNKKYVRFNEDLVYYSRGLSKYVSGKNFSDMLQYCENSTIVKFMKNLYEDASYKIYTYDTLVDLLNDWVLSLPQTDNTLKKVANCVVAFMEEGDYARDYKHSSLKVLFNDEFKIVSNLHPVFLQRDEIETSVPPRFANIEFLHPVMVKAFKKALPDVDIADYLKPLNVKEYCIEDIITCMNDHVSTFFWDKKEKRAYDCAISELKWLWSNRNNIDIQEDIYIFLPTRDGKLRKSNELYFGEDYGNEIGEELITAVNDALFVDDLMNLLSASANQLIPFLGKFGVAMYPRVEKSKISSFSNRQYWKFILEVLEYPRTEEWSEFLSADAFAKDCRGSIEVDNVTGLGSILDTCSTKTIIEWINSDKGIYEHVTNHVEPSAPPVKATWGNLRAERTIKGIKSPRSYIYFLFFTQKWIQVGDGRYTINDCLLSLDKKTDLSPELVCPDIEEYIKDLPGKRKKLRADYVSLFEKMGVKRDFAELPAEKIYSVLAFLPSLNNSGNIARTFYNQMLDEYDAIRKQLDACSAYKAFISDGEVYCTDDSYHKIKDTFYVAGKDVCNSLLEKTNVMALPKRRANFSSVPRLFGVQRVQLKGVTMKSVVEHSKNDSFQKDFAKYKSLAFSYRIDAKSDLKTAARRFGGINIHLCEEVLLTYKKDEISLRPYDYFLIAPSDYYLCVPAVINSIHTTKMGIAVSNIICSFLDVYENESDFRELFNAGSERLMILRESVDDATIQRAREAMNDEEDARDDFLQVVDKLSNRSLNEVMDLIDVIDFEYFSSIANAPAIISLFRALDIDTDDYNGEKPAVRLDLTDYYQSRVLDTLPKYRDLYYLTMFELCKNGDIEKKERFQSLKLDYNNVSIKTTNSVYFDVDAEIIKQLGIDVNCKQYDLVEIYKRNLSVFKKKAAKDKRDRVDDFLLYPENGSLIYFAEYEELLRRFNDYVTEEEQVIEAKISELVDGIEPVAAQSGAITPLIPEFHKGKVVKKTGGPPTRNKRNLADMGLRGETCVFQLLNSDPTKQNVEWVSENAQKVGQNPEGVAVLGYDMTCVDSEKGLCYIEVKASSDSLENGIHFHLSENEYRFACDNSDRYYVYYVASVYDIHPKVVALTDVFKESEFNEANYYLSAKEYYVSANYVASQTVSKKQK